MKKLSSIICAAFALLAVSRTAAAQSVEATRAGIARVNLISSNPIGLLFEWYNGEFEHALSPTVSLAVAGTSFDFDDARYNSIDGIIRYYPSARAVRGFSVGVSVGYVGVHEDSCDGCSDDDYTSATVGVRGDYVWILGRDQRFSVATGIGAKRILRDSDVDGLPIGRLSLGYAW
jgi:hypothetical protein